MAKAKWVQGSKLIAQARQQACSRFVHRPVGEGKTFATDEEWLRYTRFAIRNDGLLHETVRHCEINKPHYTVDGTDDHGLINGMIDRPPYYVYDVDGEDWITGPFDDKRLAQLSLIHHVRVAPVILI